MTQVITRYFDSVSQAQLVRNELIRRRQFSSKIISLFDEAEGLSESLTAAQVDATTAKAYQDRVAKGGAVMMVMAGYKPLGVAKTTREVTAQMGAVDLGNMVEEVFVKEELKPASSILTDHPHMLTRPRDPDSTDYHMADWPLPLISRREPFTNSIIPPHGRMANFILPLLSKRKPYTGSIVSRHGRMANFILPLLSKRKPYTGSMISRHGRMANFPLPLVSKRKPYTGSMIGRHQRMANWPFPHLINGKTGTNSLMPKGPRMAAFPISLLSNRKPVDKSIFGRHARMANFPIPLTSQRKPYTGSMISRHGRMADFILPLVVRRSEDAPKDQSRGFSLSRMFGLPTLVRR